jgi:hypothetical protein
MCHTYQFFQYTRAERLPPSDLVLQLTSAISYCISVEKAAQPGGEAGLPQKRVSPLPHTLEV